MSVDEMLWALTNVYNITGKVRISKEAARAIGEALKVGQAMRDSLGVTKHVKRDGTGMFRAADVINSMQAVQAIDAWDAATRDDSLEEYSKLSQEIGEEV